MEIIYFCLTRLVISRKRKLSSEKINKNVGPTLRQDHVPLVHEFRRHGKKKNGKAFYLDLFSYKRNT